MTTTTKRKPAQPHGLRLLAALHELLKELAKGKEFPDCDYKIAAKHNVTRDELVTAYDSRTFK